MLLVSLDLRVVEQGLGDGVEPLEQAMAVGFGDLEGEARLGLLCADAFRWWSVTVWSRRSMVTSALPGCSRPAVAIDCQSSAIELDDQQSVLEARWTRRCRRIRLPCRGR